MNRNILSDVNFIEEISDAVLRLGSKEDVTSFFKELLTNSEILTLSKRWRILNMLREGNTQRNISQALGVSLCKVTRGAKIIKDKKSIINKALKKEN